VLIHLVLKIDGGEFFEVTCPRCHGEFVSDRAWRGWCPHCRRLSKIPSDPALVYDGSETVKITMGEAQALMAVSVVAYSPEDGPNGIMFRPVDGRSMRDVYRSLPRLAG
jgi:thiol-disulfide isomerase/thioredoxin